MKNLLILFLFLTCTIAQSQPQPPPPPCIDLIRLQDDHSFQFLKPIRVNDEKTSIVTTGIVQGDLIAVVFVSTEGTGCHEKGDSITLKFVDNTIVKGINNFDSNCDGRYALYLGGEFGNKHVLNTLSSNELGSVSIKQKGTELVHAVAAGPAQSARNSFQCLSQCVTNETLVNDLKKQKSERDTLVFTVVEQQAQFPGGPGPMGEYFEKNTSRRVGAKGSVFVSFVVERNGSITQPAIIKGVSEKADAEAMRLIKEMPKWNPGRQSGRAVRTRFVLPVRFN